MASPRPTLRVFGNGPHNTDPLFDLLREAQQAHGFVTREAMETIASQVGIPVKDVHAVVSFFPVFRQVAPPKVEVKVCTDMTCHLRGAGGVYRELQQRYSGTGGQVVVTPCSCLGRCDRTLAAAINGSIYQDLDGPQISHIIEDALMDLPLPNAEVEEETIKFKSDPYESVTDRYAVLRELALKHDADEVLARLKEGGLRGMGGAGFPTAIKWDGARKDKSSAMKYVVCNADESEPGTIKDRLILQHAPHLVIEGMAIAGLVIGSREGVLYIRHEYDHLVEGIEREIARCNENGILGENIFGSGMDFDLRVFVSPGGYICGEETALMEAIEGKRGEPRNRPPRTVNKGLFGMPTALNNVETFALAVTILAKGSEWFNAQGMNGAQGLKFVGVSGDVNKPGAFEVPMGITYRELIEQYAGGVLEGTQIFGFAPSGPSSGYLPANMLDLAMDWDVLKKAGSMVGSGAVVVCSERACMLDMAINATTFYRNESCGKCVPCRVGSQKLVEMLEGWTQGEYREENMQMLEELDLALRMTSICGLGQIVPAPIQSVIKYFPEEVEDHVHRRRCRANVCFKGART